MHTQAPDHIKPENGLGLLHLRKRPLTRVKNWLRTRIEMAATRRKIIRQFDELLGMSDYHLADIGLTKGIVLQERARFIASGKLDACDLRKNS